MWETLAHYYSLPICASVEKLNIRQTLCDFPMRNSNNYDPSSLSPLQCPSNLNISFVLLYSIRLTSTSIQSRTPWNCINHTWMQAQGTPASYWLKLNKDLAFVESVFWGFKPKGQAERGIKIKRRFLYLSAESAFSLTKSESLWAILIPSSFFAFLLASLSSSSSLFLLLLLPLSPSFVPFFQSLSRPAKMITKFSSSAARKAFRFGCVLFPASPLFLYFLAFLFLRILISFLIFPPSPLPPPVFYLFSPSFLLFFSFFLLLPSFLLSSSSSISPSYPFFFFFLHQTRDLFFLPTTSLYTATLFSLPSFSLLFPLLLFLLSLLLFHFLLLRLLPFFLLLFLLPYLVC